MNNPLLVVVTGSPATGKTTLAHMLARRIRIDNYNPVNMEVATLEVDTTRDYDPDLEAIINFIRK